MHTIMNDYLLNVSIPIRKHRKIQETRILRDDECSTQICTPTHSLLSPDKASCISINPYTQVCVSVIHRFGFYDRVIKFARFPTYAGVSTRKCIEALVKDCVLTGIIEYKYYVCHAIHVLYV